MTKRGEHQHNIQLTALVDTMALVATALIAFFALCARVGADVAPQQHYTVKGSIDVFTYEVNFPVELLSKNQIIVLIFVTKKYFYAYKSM